MLIPVGGANTRLRNPDLYFLGVRSEAATGVSLLVIVPHRQSTLSIKTVVDVQYRRPPPRGPVKTLAFHIKQNGSV